MATLKASGQFTLLLKAVDATGLTPVLSSPGPLTVFAPTDAAFAAVMPADQLDAAAKDQAKLAQLQALLTYHVVNAKLPPIKGHAQTALQSVATGKKVTVDGLADPVTVNDAKVLQGEVQTSNGVIYVIDKVLSPDYTPPPPTAAPAGDPATADRGAGGGRQRCRHLGGRDHDHHLQDFHQGQEEEVIRARCGGSAALAAPC